MIANVRFDKNSVESKTRVAVVKDDGTTNIDVKILPDTETRCALLANLFLCEGLQSKVGNSVQIRNS